MKLLEYEAKAILKQSKLPVPEFVVVKPNEPILEQINFPVVVKSQVPVGGRGKAGGVKVVESEDNLPETLERLSLLEIKGHLPQVLIAEQKLNIAEERYISLLIDRESASIQLMVNAAGGMEVESQTGFYQIDISPDTIRDRSERIAGLFNEPATKQIETLLSSLYDCFVKNDATLLEINPLVKTSEGTYVCADAKMELDDAAAFRHKEWDYEDKPGDVNFVTLDPGGEIATIANGAGLAMATVDAVAAAGMTPANFLDVGGGANKASVLAAFQRIMEYKHIKAIVINIFAGITRCDEVAQAIIAARQEIASLPPLFIRLSGTNYEAAVDVLKAEDIPLQPTLADCLKAAKETIA
ncbi:hypothetical protein EYC58_02055 [Candidatus Saccharibacteria bacterium]|nr:MAG: hypothetical protein EYC58_02055 [Candidatus Saccharibacteria bacterium]